MSEAWTPRTRFTRAKPAPLSKSADNRYIQKGDLRRAAWEELLALARFAPWFPTEWAFRPQDVNCTGFGQLSAAPYPPCNR